MEKINLQNTHGCLAELEACSNGLAYFDHLYSRVLDQTREAEAVWESIEAEAAAAARDDARSGATAVEIKGLMTAWVDKRPSHSNARLLLRKLQADEAKLERFTRSLEKRMSAAQSAAKAHELIARQG